MKTLTLIRHATANDARASQPDSARNLSELGRFQAEDIAKQLYSKQWDCRQGAAKESNHNVYNIHEDCEPSGNTVENSSAKSINQKNCLPDYLLCSPANRTLQTATLLCHTLQLNPDIIKVNEILYSGDTDDILSALHGVDSQQLCVVGHNPHLSWLAHLLCNSTKTITLPPAGVISLAFEIEDWSELTKAQGRLLFFIEPHHESS
ncbi:putative phosphohistidine phosphatase SixA [Candidatus Rickettsiella viridis]|uniref:Putative phosphohistidine phosphatase SixA n=1 Tax=Candidatus Rickettsiella viridis TaxID=676208 RepID=A0A2Z5UW55_9COXI|nr:hypothetical protein [Candidatus Rickettsiella viridis]BBB15856.1 putative phosphohistidine phosphatase SixA [Candidatus Rickettsiella viridis]